MARALLSVGIVLAMLLACSSVQVTVDFDPEEDFSRFRTFGWLPNRPVATRDYRVDDPLLEQRIRRAVDRELEGRGLRRLEGSVPDLYVTYLLSVEDKIDVYRVQRSYVDYWGYTSSIPETRVDRYEEGSLVIDIADAADKELIWRGVGVGRLRQRSGPGPSAEAVDAAVVDILASFPPAGDRAD